MTQEKRVADDVLAAFARRQHDWMERVLKGSLDPEEVSRVVQKVIDQSQQFSPHSFFKPSGRLCICDSFSKKFLQRAEESIPHRGLKGVVGIILSHRMLDQEIIDKLLCGMEEARKHAFTLDQIASMINIQLDGGCGELLNNGNYNIFYVLVDGVPFAVGVNWEPSYRWIVNSWCLGEEGYWDTGSRVFRNTTL